MDTPGSQFAQIDNNPITLFNNTFESILSLSTPDGDDDDDDDIRSLSTLDGMVSWFDKIK